MIDSKNVSPSPKDLQREYYARTAQDYDRAHQWEPAHERAFHWLLGTLIATGAEQVLEIGSGTGRMLAPLAAALPAALVLGVEPVPDLIRAGGAGLAAHRNAIAFCGDGHRLPFADASIDFVCAFAVLHHVPKPELLLAEMIRVARRGIFLSDGNNFGQGRRATRWLKQAINSFGAWRLFDWMKTGFKGYHYSEGDGVFYSFSMFSHLRFLERRCASVHVMNTCDRATNHYRNSGHVALLGLK